MGLAATTSPWLNFGLTDAGSEGTGSAGAGSEGTGNDSTAEIDTKEASKTSKIFVMICLARVQTDLKTALCNTDMGDKRGLRMAMMTLVLTK